MANVDFAGYAQNTEYEPSKLANQPSEVDADYCAKQVRRAGKLLEKGNIAAAESVLRQGLERVPEHPECVAYLAVCLAAGQRKYVTAEKLVKNIIKNQPYDPTAWYALGRINLLGGRREQAFKNFDRAVKVSCADAKIEMAVEEMDPRRDPVLIFLPRDHFLNIMLGRMRSKLGG